MGWLSKRWKAIGVWALLVLPYIGDIFKWIDRLVGWGGSLDFLIARSKDPGWVGKMLSFLIDPPAVARLLCLILAILLLLRLERVRTDKKVAEALSGALPAPSTNGAASPVSTSALFPDWPVWEIVKRAVDEQDIPPEQFASDAYRERLALWIADTVALGKLTVWGRTYKRPLSNITFFWSNAKMVVAKQSCALIVPSIDSIHDTHYTDLTLNKAQAEEWFFTVVTIEDQPTQ